MDPNPTLKFPKTHDNFSLDPFHAQEVRSETLSRELEKTKISKCSVSNQNFRGRIYMYVMSIKWNNFIKIHPINLFIHDSSGFLAFPQVLSLDDKNSSKFSQMASKF